MEKLLKAGGVKKEYFANGKFWNRLVLPGGVVHEASGETRDQAGKAFGEVIDRLNTLPAESPVQSNAELKANFGL